MPRPHKPSAYEIELERKIDTLQIRLLQINAAMRVKVLYAERLEHLVCDRNKRVDSLYGLLEHARQQNQKLDEENERLAALIAADHRSQTHIDGELETP